jgi:hypothetical protein
MSITIENLSNSVAADGCPAAITDAGVRAQIEKAVSGGGKVELIDAGDGSKWIAELRGGKLSLEIAELPPG